jgi:hypothetical protein
VVAGPSILNQGCASWQDGAVAASRGVVELVEEHVCAFNALDVGRVLRGLAEDVVWQTGSDTFVGLDQVERLLRGAVGLFRSLRLGACSSMASAPLSR